MQNLDVPCGITVLGSQKWDDSTQCRMVDRSSHMFQKAKQKQQQQQTQQQKQQQQQQQRK